MRFRRRSLAAVQLHLALVLCLGTVPLASAPRAEVLTVGAHGQYPLLRLALEAASPYATLLLIQDVVIDNLVIVRATVIPSAAKRAKPVGRVSLVVSPASVTVLHRSMFDFDPAIRCQGGATLTLRGSRFEPSRLLPRGGSSGQHRAPPGGRRQRRGGAVELVGHGRRCRDSRHDP